MPRPHPVRDDKPPVSPEATARHMADAVEFLTRVAKEAGLRRIAVKLRRVRTSLLEAAADRQGEPQSPTSHSMDKPHGQRKPS